MRFALPPPRRLLGLLGLASLASSAMLATVGHAQQVTTPDGAVTIDYGVLSGLGSGQSSGDSTNQSTAEEAAGGPSYGFPQAPTAGPQPAANQTQAQPVQTGQLLSPPSENPVSGLTIPPPAGSVPYLPSTAAVRSAGSTLGKPTSKAATSSGVASGGILPPALAVAPPAPATKTATAATSEAETTAVEPSAPSATSAPLTNDIGAAAVATGVAPPPSAIESQPSAGAGIAPPPPPEASPGASPTPNQASATAGIAPPPPAESAGAATPSSESSAASSAPSTQTAAVPPAASTEGQLRIVFSQDSSEIPEKLKPELDALAQKLNADESLRVQLLAYASGTGDQASQARRMSLSRALAVRSYLIKQGVRSTRMDVRALGNNVKDSPQDRVDIISRAQ